MFSVGKMSAHSAKLLRRSFSTSSRSLRRTGVARKAVVVSANGKPTQQLYDLSLIHI